LKTSIYPVDCPKFVYLIKTFLIWLTCHGVTTLVHRGCPLPYQECKDKHVDIILVDMPSLDDTTGSNLEVLGFDHIERYP